MNSKEIIALSGVGVLEIIGFNIESCRIAQAAGATRIELCDGPKEGGTTPSFGFVKAARKLLHIPLYTMIRPRGGDFLYSADEFEIMKSDIHHCKQLGSDGVVLGLLNNDGTVDTKRTAQLVEFAYPMRVTFHRAFDRCANPFEAMEQLINIGCERILTSGQHTTAMEGATLLNNLIRQADDRIIIMPGSAVKSSNIAELAKKTGASEFHASASIWVNSKMEYANSNINENLQNISVDKEEVGKLIEQLSRLFK